MKFFKKNNKLVKPETFFLNEELNEIFNIEHCELELFKIHDPLKFKL